MESYFDGYLPVAAGVRAAVRYEKETFFMSDTPNEKKFMREKVVKPPIDKRRAAGRILCYVLFAAVFGGVAAVSFVASLPTAKKLLGKEQPVTSAPITIERDQDPSGEPTPVETMAAKSCIPPESRCW